MDELKKKFQKATAHITLEEKERISMREYLLEYLKMKPVRSEAGARLLKEQRLFISIVTSKRIMPIALIVALVFAGGGGVSLAAENAVPGDVLYPVKVSVNEEVRRALSFSTEAKAKWDARRAGRRLGEAEKLASENRLDADVKAQIEENFERFAARAEEKIKVLEVENPEAAARVSARFESALEAHKAILSRLETSSGDASAVAEIRAKVNIRAENAGRARIDAVGGVIVDTKANAEARANAAERMKVKAETEFRSAQNTFDRVKADLSANAQTRIESQLETAAGHMEEGNAALEAGIYGEAFIEYQNAFQISIMVERLMKAGLHVNLDILINSAADAASRRNTEGTRGSDNEESNGSEEGGRGSSILDVIFRGSTDAQNRTNAEIRSGASDSSTSQSGSGVGGETRTRTNVDADAEVNGGDTSVEGDAEVETESRVRLGI
ncbi:MAG: DUF5667 domain-containing protein [Candidatus Paceibacterota bacterium]